MYKTVWFYFVKIVISKPKNIQILILKLLQITSYRSFGNEKIIHSLRFRTTYVKIFIFKCRMLAGLELDSTERISDGYTLNISYYLILRLII